VKEAGFECTNTTSDLPDQLVLPIIYRDFKAFSPGPGGHPDFEHYDAPDPSQDTLQLVEDTLGADGNPTWKSNFGRNEANTAANTVQQLTGATEFAQWYNDDLPAKPFYDQTITLNKSGNTYVFETTEFFPLDNLQGTWGKENSGRDFGFTSELRYWFTYGGGEKLEFFGDDDVWVFINGKLAVDLGGRHSQELGSITLDDAHATQLGLTAGGLYEVDVFHAEVHTGASTYKLTLGGFEKVVTSCVAKCGDGVKTKYEACDDGTNAGGYNGCAPGCVLGPRCGDGKVDSESGEVCDDGNQVGGDGCSNTCTHTGPN
jgi:fibro-slime domain-containing protein